MKKKVKILLVLFITAILLHGFAVPVNMVGNWYQQFMPNLGGRQITDITFVDSLVGYAITNSNGQNDTAFILKTINGGDNWSKIYFRTAQFTGFYRVFFEELNTGYVCGISIFNGAKGLTKTTDGGQNWADINTPDPFLTYWDLSVLNQDTIWLVSSESTSGGVFRTTNGGANWTWQLNIGSSNPKKIYMYNRNLGFISSSTGSQLYRTTNSGDNWAPVNGENGFNDMFFVDSLTGWKAFGPVKKTINGGLNWITQTMPSGGIFTFTGAGKLSVLNKDTLWAVGGSVEYPNLQNRGVIYRTINGGDNWLFQIPDTTIHLGIYYYITFVNNRIGWVYSNYNSGVHTTTGGDPGWITGVRQVSTEIPKEFRLFQNYPNPFNASSIIKFEMSKSGFAELNVFDITGRAIQTIVNQKLNAGTYETEFNGNNFSSGVYFYRLIVDNLTIETKKLILIK